MDKKEVVDYKQFEKERIISISDLIESILRRIWVVVVLAIVFAVIFGGYKYIQDRSALEAANTIQTANIETSISETEMQQVEQIIRLKNQLKQQEQYMENSVLMKLNPYMENQVCVQMAVQTQGANVSSVLNSLEFYVSDGALAADLQQIYPDDQANYLGELVSFERSADLVSLASTEMAEFDRGNVFCIKIVQTDHATCETLAADVQECIQKYQAESSAILGAYDVVVIDVSATTVVDHSLMSYQTEKNDSLETLRNMLSSEESALTESQVQILNQYSGTGEENAETMEDGAKNDVVVSVNKKYVGIGAVLGILIGIIVLVLQYLIRGTLNLALEFQSMFNIRVFGQVDLFEKKNVFVAIWRKLLNKRKRLSVEEEQRLVVSNVQSYCKRNQISKVLFVGSRNLHDISCVNEMTESLEKVGIQADMADGFPYSADAMERIQDYPVAIFVETLHVSRYEDVLNGVKKCLEQGRQIGGAIVFN